MVATVEEKDNVCVHPQAIQDPLGVGIIVLIITGLVMLNTSSIFFYCNVFFILKFPIFYHMGHTFIYLYLFPFHMNYVKKVSLEYVTIIIERRM